MSDYGESFHMYEIHIWCFGVLIYFFSNLYNQRGAQTQDSEIRSCMLFRLSQSGVPEICFVLCFTFVVREKRGLKYGMGSNMARVQIFKLSRRAF